MDEERINSAGLSFIGKYREENQDSIRLHIPVHDDPLTEWGCLFGIADGMGGYSHGGVASSTALDAFFTSFYASPQGKPQQILRTAVTQANTAVQRESVRRGSVRMGTTLSAVNILGNQLFISHIGDSRVYLIRGRQVTCLTDDHTKVGELVRMKLLPPSNVRTHEQRSILNRCLGVQMFVQPDISQHTLQSGDYLVLCTDGLWSVIEDEEFGQFVHDKREPAQINEALIEEAMKRDSDDNASAITIQVKQFAPTPSKLEKAKSERGLGLGKLLSKRLFAGGSE